MYSLIILLVVGTLADCTKPNGTSTSTKKYNGTSSKKYNGISTSTKKYNGTSTKKGLSVAGKQFLCGDLEAFSSISWYYNWGQHPNNENHGCDPAPPGFVPMIWGWWGQDLPHLEYDTVLGFNEPNHHNQANLEPEVAAAAWIELQEAYPDKILVSPSAAPPNTEEWFDRFFEACSLLNCRIDYLATHMYTGNADHDVETMNNLYKKYGKKVWLTEFAKPNTRDPEKVLNYMKAILPQLEEAESVWRYSWFVTRFGEGFEMQGSGANKSEEGGWYLDKANALLDQHTSTLTKLGQYYNNF